jgi:cell division protein ZapB
MSDDSFQTLNAKVDDLIGLCEEMKRENQQLKATASSWQSERKELLGKSQETKGKLQSILERLKAMDPS